jgi:hypothetical protein
LSNENTSSPLDKRGARGRDRLIEYAVRLYRHIGCNPISPATTLPFQRRAWKLDKVAAWRDAAGPDQMGNSSHAAAEASNGTEALEIGPRDARYVMVSSKFLFSWVYLPHALTLSSSLYAVQKSECIHPLSPQELSQFQWQCRCSPIPHPKKHPIRICIVRISIAYIHHPSLPPPIRSHLIT